MKQNKFLASIRFTIAGILAIQLLFSEDTLQYAMPQVVVQSSRLSLSVFDMNQSVSVIPEEQLRNASPISVEDALRMFTTTEMRRRGAMGIQADVGVRGSTFSQQLILLNGTRINDPQTAHHNFDLPVSMNSIKQIEVVRGPNSAQYGPDAFGGVINIVTNTTAPMLSVELSGGQFGYAGGMAAYGLHQENFHSLNTVDYKRSDGFQYDTEFETLSLSSQNSADVSWGKIHFFSGYTKKDFGAFDFYSPGLKVPSHEKTETIFGAIGADFITADWNIVSRVSYRHHYDDFIYTIIKPSLSHNQHNTNQYVAELSGVRAFSSQFSISNAVEITHDNINSTKLGVHKRQFAAFSSVMRWIPKEWISVDGGVRVDAHSDYGLTLHPILNIGYLFSESSKLYGSAGTSFRAPSYTDLYYNDPSNIGNPNLKPERGISFELGFHSRVLASISFQASGFYREQNNLIDYVQYFSGDKYHAENFSEATVRGIELESSWMNVDRTIGTVKQARIGYTFIESQLDTKNSFRTKYSFTHPKHQVNGFVTAELPLSIMTTLSGTYRYGIKLPSSSTFDLTFVKSIESIDLILSASNLLNNTYEEIPGIPLPGRWVVGKVRWSLL